MAEEQLPEEEEHLEPQGELEAEDQGAKTELDNVVKISGMYQEWFLDYASYVILERAVPHINDGLKPVQRRIMHSMYEMDDSRFHKVANIIGNTMKYHPHGDASIGDALVQIGQKDLMIDCQGNWGNIFTGDSSAAPRYIEARLTKFALEIAFNPKTTKWLSSYDGRNKEPLTLPMKFPLLLAHGVEGIAVGLACKILPHNFLELIDSSIAILENRPFVIYPDFPTAGMVDVSNYNDGLRGGKIKVRARIQVVDKKTLMITEIPFGTTTTSLIDSILKANDKGKIKVKKIEDNTAEFVEIVIHLTPGVSPDKTIDALYAFTDCETSISPNSGIIEDDRPKFLGVREILQRSTSQTLDLLKLELQIKKGELEEQWFFASLEKIFIEKRIYRKIEECETWEAIIETIHKGLAPHVKDFFRPVTDEDVARLTEIKIKRISKFDGFKADELLARLLADIEQVKYHLDNIVTFTIDYYKRLREKYGKGRERKTEIKSFETIDAVNVVMTNEKLYANLEEGFIGIGLKRGEGEFISECSDIDDIVVIRKDCNMIVSKVSAKAFFGKDILYVGIWKKDDSRTIYNLIYQDGPRGNTFMKRFPVTSITRDKEYHLGSGTKGSKMLYMSVNPNGEAEIVNVFLRPQPKLKKLKFELDFTQLAIKGRSAKGNTLSKYPIQKIVQKEKGISTLAPMKIWFDDTVNRINTDGRGDLVGAFSGSDKIITIMQSGHYKLTGFELTTHFDQDIILIQKYNPDKIFSVVYFDGEKQTFYTKRFTFEDTDKKVSFISEAPGSYLEFISEQKVPQVVLALEPKKNGEVREPETINLVDFIAVKGMKAQGNRLSAVSVLSIELLPPTEEEIEEEPEEPEEQDVEIVDEGSAEAGDSPVSKPETPEHKSPIRPLDDPPSTVQITLDF